EDIVQNVFCSVWNDHKGVLMKQSILAYLSKSVINLSLNHIRAQKSRMRREENFAASVYQERNFTEEIILLKELHIRVNEVIDALPAACRLVFVLSRYERLSYKEIAGKLNISVKTVENHMVK